MAISESNTFFPGYICMEKSQMPLNRLMGRGRRAVHSLTFCAFVAGSLFGLTSVQAGSIEGRASFEGERPKRDEVALLEVSLAGARNSECVKLHKDSPLLTEDAIVGEKGELANVVVYVKSPVTGNFPVPAEPAMLDQVGCRYEPHILTMRTGQTLDVRNSDPLVHNVRSFPKENRPFNMGQGEGNVREKVLRKAENAIKIKCDIHRWMTGYIFVFDNPFHAVSAADGSFSIEGLPAGEYTLAAWHEVYGEQEAKVTVGEDGAASVNFTFKKAE